MNRVSVGRLEQVSLRTVWPHEAGTFTPWLAQPANLELLGEALGIELAPDTAEVGVGSFRADIICREVADDTIVVIENQIAKSDHDHLGKLLTYAAGVRARVLVWVAEKFTEDHRAARLVKQSQRRRCFILRIGNYCVQNRRFPSAPKFVLVSKPNNWSKAVQTASRAVFGTNRRRNSDLRNEFLE